MDEDQAQCLCSGQDLRVGTGSVEPAGRLVYVVLRLTVWNRSIFVGIPLFLYDLRFRSLVPPQSYDFYLSWRTKCCFVFKFLIVHLKHLCYFYVCLLITKEEKHFSILSSFCRTVVKKPKTLGNPNSEMKDTNLVMVQKLLKTSISSSSRVNFW